MRIEPPNTCPFPRAETLDPDAKSAADPKRDAQMRQVSRDMEAVFLTQLFKVMAKTVPTGPLSGRKNTLPSVLFSSVMGKAVAESGGIGLAEVIYRSLREKDEVPDAWTGIEAAPVVPPFAPWESSSETTDE